MNTPVPAITIAHVVADGAARAPNLDVLTFEHAGVDEIRTYAQLWDNGRRIAGALSARGLARGDRLALVLPNHPEFVETMVACACLGLIFVPIDPRLRGERLAFMLRHCQCRAMLTVPEALGDALAIAEAAPALERILVVGERAALPAQTARPVIEPFSDLLARSVPTLQIAVQDGAEPMEILYTSGTTGNPKGVLIRHARFAAIAEQGSKIYGYQPGDRPYTGLSLTHGNAQFATLAPALSMGLRAVISRRFSKQRFWATIRRHQCTVFSLLGGMATGLYSEPPRADDADNPVRLVTSAGMPAALWLDFERRFGLRIAEYYGAVEGGQTLKPVGEGPIGSCGRVAPGLIGKIVNEDGDEVPRGTPGEILFRPADGSPAVVEYFDDPQAALEKTRGGWLHTGDIVRMDAEGWVFFQYRKGSGIRRNGDFIDPAIIEKRLAQHADITDVYVFGIPAASGAPGEKDIVAAIVPAAGRTAPIEALFDWCAQGLERSAVPTYLHVVAEIPKTASEKPQERFLLESFRAHPQNVFQHAG